MVRPEQVYLPEAEKLYGIEVRYTEEGCHYLIEHWTAVLEITDENHTNPAHIRKLIDNWNLYIQLYERRRAEATGAPAELPDSAAVDSRKEAEPTSHTPQPGLPAVENGT